MRQPRTGRTSLELWVRCLTAAAGGALLRVGWTAGSLPVSSVCVVLGVPAVFGAVLYHNRPKDTM